MSDATGALSSAWTAVWPMVLGWRAATASTARPGEVDGGARLRLAGGCGPAPAKGQQITKGVAGTLVR
jgi:hypothetical protein